MQANLVVVSGKVTKSVVALNLPTVLGRSREADLTVAHPLISRRHCKIFEQDGLLMVRDLGSLNGTMIDGRRIEEGPLLPEGEFTVGPLTFRVQYEFDGDLEAVPTTKFVEEALPVSDEAAVEYEAAEELADESPDFTLDESRESEPAIEDSGEADPSHFMAWADPAPEDEMPEVSPEALKVQPAAPYEPPAPYEDAEDFEEPSPPPSPAEIAAKQASRHAKTAAPSVTPPSTTPIFPASPAPAFAEAEPWSNPVAPLATARDDSSPMPAKNPSSIPTPSAPPPADPIPEAVPAEEVVKVEVVPEDELPLEVPAEAEAADDGDPGFDDFLKGLQ